MEPINICRLNRNNFHTNQKISSGNRNDYKFNVYGRIEEDAKCRVTTFRNVHETAWWLLEHKMIHEMDVCDEWRALLCVCRNVIINYLVHFPLLYNFVRALHNCWKFAKTTHRYQPFRWLLFWLFIGPKCVTRPHHDVWCAAHSVAYNRTGYYCIFTEFESVSKFTSLIQLLSGAGHVLHKMCMDNLNFSPLHD